MYLFQALCLCFAFWALLGFLDSFILSMEPNGYQLFSPFSIPCKDSLSSYFTSFSMKKPKLNSIGILEARVKISKVTLLKITVLHPGCHVKIQPLT